MTSLAKLHHAFIHNTYMTVLMISRYSQCPIIAPRHHLHGDRTNIVNYKQKVYGLEIKTFTKMYKV